MDEHDEVLRTGGGELLAGALTGHVLGLTDVHHVGLQAVEGAETRVARDDLDALGRGLRERILQGAGVRHRRRDHVHLGRDRSVEACDLLGDVVVRVHLRGADAACLEVAHGLVDTLLEHGPEGAAVTMCDDRDLRPGGGRRAECRRRRRTAEDRSAGGQQAALDDEASAAETFLRRFDRFLLAHVPLLPR